MTATDPLIILGMHRSGTSLLANCLIEMGWFAGAHISHHDEAHFFVNQNRWLLRQAGCAWDNPLPFAESVADSRTRRAFSEYLQFISRSPRIIQYLGVSRYLRYRCLDNISEPWGWKDPRMVFTLPVWLELFPTAKIIYIYRNGVDVAASLATRSQKTNTRFSTHWKKLHNRLIYSVFWKTNPAMLTRHLDLQTGFHLWELYNNQAHEHLAGIASDRQLILSYEALLANDDNLLQKIADFAHLSPSASQLRTLRASFTPSRSSAFLEDEELLDFYNEVRQSPAMVRLGYDQHQVDISSDT